MFVGIDDFYNGSSPVQMNYKKGALVLYDVSLQLFHSIGCRYLSKGNFR